MNALYKSKQDRDYKQLKIEASFFAWFAAGFSCGDAPTSGSTEARFGHWVNPAACVADPVVPLANGAPVMPRLMAMRRATA